MNVPAIGKTRGWLAVEEFLKLSMRVVFPIRRNLYSSTIFLVFLQNSLHKK